MAGVIHVEINVDYFFLLNYIRKEIHIVFFHKTRDVPDTKKAG